MRCSAHYVTPFKIFSIYEKSSHRFLKILFSLNYETKNIGHRTRLTENEHLFLCRAKLEGILLRCVCARARPRAPAFVRANNDAKIVRTE